MRARCKQIIDVLNYISLSLNGYVLTYGNSTVTFAIAYISASQIQKVRKTSLKESEITQSTPSSACDQPSSSSKCDEPISASRLKMRPQNSSDCPSNSLDDGETVQSEGYRLVDLKKLSSTLSEAHVCDEGKNSEKQNTVCSVQMMLYGKMCVVVEFGLLF